MLKDIRFPSTFEYRSGSEHEPLEFFFATLLESNKLDLLGYFSSFSNSGSLTSFLASFIANGGTGLLLINIYLPMTKKYYKVE